MVGAPSQYSGGPYALCAARSEEKGSGDACGTVEGKVSTVMLVGKGWMGFLPLTPCFPLHIIFASPLI